MDKEEPLEEIAAPHPGAAVELFGSPEQAHLAAKMGMWIFLVTEVLLFGGLFTLYGVYRRTNLAMFEAGARELDWSMGALNTLILLFSSYLVALAVNAARSGQNKRTRQLLLSAVLCGGGFLAVKFLEYREKFIHGLFPPRDIYFGLYFSMTGLHALHVIAGMAVLWWAAGCAKKRLFSPLYYSPAEVSGLYWHLVDVIWIYLFPLLYLI